MFILGARKIAKKKKCALAQKGIIFILLSK
jgi:hypothetical protein